MTEWNWVRAVFCVFILVWAIITDCRWHKIRNYTVIAGIAGGLLLNHDRFGNAVLGMLAPLTLIFLFALEVIGAGDVKLLCAVGAIVGYPEIVNVILYAFVLCGFMFIIYLLVKKRLIQAVKGFWQSFLSIVLTEKLEPAGLSSPVKLPMAGCILAAYLLVTATRAQSTPLTFLF